jgi:hypothetical protein
MKSTIVCFSAIIFLITFGGCAAPDVPGDITPPGFSGMTRFDADSFLVVHDVKSGRDNSRISLISISADHAPVLRPIVVDDWMDPEGPANDLESVCAIPQRHNEFIVLEAGSWKGKFGRLFHIAVDAETRKASVLGSAKMPIRTDTDPVITGDQIEGLACALKDENTLLLILGERGGSKAYPSGTLRWGSLNLLNHDLEIDEAGRIGINIDAPGNWTDSKSNRDISGLYLTADNYLWISGSEELAEAGTFYSVIYKAGRVVPENPVPLQINFNPQVWREVAGFKIEAVAAPSPAVADSMMSFATEDEIFGGVWRAIR